MRKNFIVIFILLTFIMPSAALAGEPTVTITAAERKMAEAITADQLRDYLYFVASDEMEGRDTPSRGLDLTAKFIGTLLSRWGFKPAGDDGTFFQKMMFRSEVLEAEKQKLNVGGTDFKFADDFLRLSGNTSVDAPLVFGGDGWLVKSKGINAFADVSVKDKIVVLYSKEFSMRSRGMPPMPKGVAATDLTGEPGSDWADPVTHARVNGAKGVIIVAAPQLQSFWGQARGFLSRGSRGIEGLEDGVNPNEAMPIMLVTETTGEAIFAGESANKDSAKAFDLTKKATLNTEITVIRTPTQNVVALWEGSDPKLKSEMVAIGAHYDHEGVRPDAPGDDKIWNGADDDGSGTVAVLAIGEALARAPQRPKRSILLVWHAGEEKGLLGSKYFNKYPTVDIKNVVAQLNIDMIGRSKAKDDSNSRNKDLSGENEIYVIGSEMMSTTLGSVTKQTNESYLKLGYNLKYDDPADTNQFFFRSDHFNYAVNGIPIVFWFDGVHQDYHQASDSADKIDYVKMEKVTRTIFLTLWEIAELNQRPAVDKALPKELMQRN